MMITDQQQFIEAIERSRSTAIFLPAMANIDAIGSGLALSRFIESYGKKSEVISSDFAPEPHFSFLKDIKNVKSDLHAPRHSILTIPFSGDLHDLSHEVDGGVIKIKITPKTGALNANMVTASASEWRHDLIITVGVRELKNIRRLHDEHRNFFEETQIINIDHRPENEHYGTINILDMRAAALAELVAEIFENADNKRFDDESATCLLAGLISETKSFRTPSVSPRTLETAGRLVTHGARREQIIESLFRTRPIEALRLWGRVLARLKADREHKMVWSVLGREDFMHAGTDETHLHDVIDELIARAPDADIIFLLHEDPREAGVLHGTMSAQRGWNALDLVSAWKPSGTTRRAKFSVSGKSLPTFEQEITSAVRAQVIATRQ